MFDTDDIAEMVVRAARDRPGDLAIFAPDGQQISFERLDRAIRGIAHNLDRHGVQPGDVVQVIVDNPVVQISGWIAAMRLGARPVILGGQIPQNAGLNIDLVVALPDQTVTGIRRADLDQSWLDPPENDPPMRPGQGYFCASSGTTGTMKFLDRSAEDMARQLEKTAKYCGAIDGPFLNCFSVHSTPLIGGVLRAFAFGRGIVLPASSPAETLRRACRVGFTCATAPPPMFEDFCDVIESGEAPRPENVGHLYTTGGSISIALMQRVERCFGAPMTNGYGSIETAMIAIGVAAHDPEPELGLVGHPVDDVAISIRDAQGQDVPPGGVGQIHVRIGRGLMVRSYVTRPVPVDENGWFATGDVGRLREDGQLVLTGRTAEMINVGGANRAPAYFEAVILAQPGVARAAAFGVPGDGGYDRLGFAVVPGAGFDEAAVRTALNEHFAGVRDIDIYVMPSLPLGRTGKIDRRALRDQAMGDDNQA